jgi:hypothetical protein
MINMKKKLKNQQKIFRKAKIKIKMKNHQAKKSPKTNQQKRKKGK